MTSSNNTSFISQNRFHTVLTELLFQLADDDFILSYRGSEWLGLAPHIEEDVAFSSISQDLMGHAAMYYQLLEDLGVGKMDDLAHGRPYEERRNAVVLELVNGPGHYLVEPQYDWAFAVVRNFFYTEAKKIRIDSLKTSCYKPLSDIAIKVKMELYYHLLHWRTWFTQLISASGEARTRMEAAIKIVTDDFGGMLSLGPKEREMVELGLIESEEVLKKRWINSIKPIFESMNLVFPKKFGLKNGNGRNGEHTVDLKNALETLSEVYQIDPNAVW
ncbi:1,2-phenylacetyl-CoA epoxidase subunit PaaC [Fredinandcohnia quinoae]|uniref:Phenylacetate-CoA oxygenase subunit PaaC n=1 Tax=Fredinandcohnia quinoae TaxID=2918902 RepID=A0AAW5E8F4_9BACI|nr:1,2-phenylacetyl-CoA epoxidase subunit PaaC [Fredinandcohnia sp. SECRCQ15]MCH1626301.1 phenylacetate-CoA oxygenase subunit PaaC [Fredinandcohnia sp. SECRCQ15]